MKFFAKLGHLILGILLGVCLVVGGVAAALFAGGGVGVVSDLTQGAFNPPDDVKKLSVAGYVGKIISVAGQYNTSTFGELEDAIGFNITAELANVIGIDRKILRDATVDTVFEDVLNGYTMTTLTDKFGIELPDMPIFTDEEFLSKPVTEAFDYLSSSLDFNEMTVKDLDTKFGIALSGDPFDSETVQNSKISELGETVQKLALGDFVTIITEAEVDMYGFEFVAVQEEGDAATVLANWLKNEKFGNLFGILNGVADPVPYNPDGEGDFHYFADITKENADGTTTVIAAKDLQNQWITEYNAAHPDETVTSFVEWAKENPAKYLLFKENPELNSDGVWCQENGIPSLWAPFALPKVVTEEAFAANRPVLSNKVLLYLADATIGGINDKFSTMTLGNVIEIDDNTHFIIKKVENSTLSTVAADLTTAIETTMMKDLLGLKTEYDVMAWDAKYKTAAEIAEWVAGQTAYKDDNENFDYFDTVEEQRAWIDATFAETGVRYYDLWDWVADHYGFIIERGDFIDLEEDKSGASLYDEWARIIDRESGTVNDKPALKARYDAEIAPYLNGATEGTPEYAAAEARYFAEEYGLYCYELAMRYCIAKPVKPEVIGADTPERPVASNRILVAIGGFTAKNISEKMDNLYVKDIFGAEAFEDGVMSLIPQYTTIDDLPAKITEKIQTTTIWEMLNRKIFLIDGKTLDELSFREYAIAQGEFSCTISEYLTKIIKRMADA